VLAGVYVVPRLGGGVLGCDVEVTHAPLQRRGLIKRNAAGQGKAGIGDTDTRGDDPNRGLCTLGEESLILQGSGLRMAPMGGNLGIEKGLSRTQVGRDSAKLGLK
jgi:hypothetical protein